VPDISCFAFEDENPASAQGMKLKPNTMSAIIKVKIFIDCKNKVRVADIAFFNWVKYQYCCINRELSKSYDP
jgi:hypothetical protein